MQTISYARCVLHVLLSDLKSPYKVIRNNVMMQQYVILYVWSLTAPFNIFHLHRTLNWSRQKEAQPMTRTAVFLFENVELSFSIDHVFCLLCWSSRNWWYSMYSYLSQTYSTQRARQSCQKKPTGGIVAVFLMILAGYSCYGILWKETQNQPPTPRPNTHGDKSQQKTWRASRHAQAKPEKKQKNLVGSYGGSPMPPR